MFAKAGAEIAALSITLLGTLAGIIALNALPQEFRWTAPVLFVAAGVAFVIGVILIIVRVRRDHRQDQLEKEEPSAFAVGDIGTAVFRNNSSTADNFFRGRAKDATFENNTHEPDKK
ncbi:hypothetical protein ACFZA2_10315 [Microbacterium sp. NPDC007973]|uniref:hypothetical protein n=1 Tax=Microbacterium sp. NPDC007973 TaxID=3364182 RepID=UPI0036F04FA8